MLDIWRLISYDAHYYLDLEAVFQKYIIWTMDGFVSSGLILSQFLLVL